MHADTQPLEYYAPELLMNSLNHTCCGFLVAGCAPGYYLGTSGSETTRRCIICEVDNYCPGGTEFQSAWTSSSGTGKMLCPQSSSGTTVRLVTRNTGASSVAFCGKQGKSSAHTHGHSQKV
jgi:hypothetical protein